MCGRFTQAYTWRELVTLYGLTQPAMNLQPRYNIGGNSAHVGFYLARFNVATAVPPYGGAGSVQVI